MGDVDLVVLNAGEHLFESPTSENLVDLVWRILPALAAHTIGTPVVLLPSTSDRSAQGSALCSKISSTRDSKLLPTATSNRSGSDHRTTPRSFRSCSIPDSSSLVSANERQQTETDLCWA